MNFCTVLSLSLLSVLFISPCINAQPNTTFRVGVVLDTDSLIGRIGMTSLSLALSDFYSSHSNYTTRIVLNTTDSRGQVTDAADRALSLLKDVKVDAIIGPQETAQASFVIGLGEAAKVPVISFSATSPSLHPQTLTFSYFLQTAINDAAQVDAVAAIVKYFKWCQVVLIYEDSDYGNGITPYLANAFQQVNARVSYRSVIPVSASDGFLLQELYKMKTMQTRVFVVHTTSALASRIFLKAREAEMMSDGYVWIVTSAIMDLFYSLDSKVVESMQGVLGVKPLVPISSRLNSTTIKWTQKFADDHPNITNPLPEMNLYGLWAYDTLWALAMAAEKTGFSEPSFPPNTTAPNSTNIFTTGTSQTGPKLLAAMLETKFEGLSGNFQLVNGQLQPSSFQILNVKGNSLKEVGIWTPLLQSSSRMNANLTGFSGEKLDRIIWPGEWTNVPKGWETPVSGKKLRVGVPAVAGFPEFVKVETDPETNATKITGLYIDMFDAVIAALPYAVRYEYVPFNISDKSYDTYSNEVANGNYDAAVGDITITAKRSELIDFTLPIEDGGVNNIQKMDYKINPNDRWFFWKPLKWELWLTTVALLILTGVALWILEHKYNRAFRGPPSEHLGLIFYIPFMSIVFANRERIVSNLARLVVVVWIFVVLILNSTYTASLSARLTTLEAQKIYTDLSTLITNGDKVGCREGSFIIEFLQGLNFTDSNIKRFKTAEDFDNALWKGDIKAMFSRTTYTNLFLSKYCNKYMTVGTPNVTKGVAFVFPKGSPLVADVSRAIIKLTDSQRISEIRGHWVRESACTEDNPPSNLLVQISLKSFEILFRITAGITGTCLLVFLVSYLYENRDFIRRIFSNSSATLWSKIRAIFKHFDQRDPRSFRSREDIGNASPDLNANQRHFSTEETASENGSVSPNPDRPTAAAHQSSSCPP